MILVEEYVKCQKSSRVCFHLTIAIIIEILFRIVLGKKIYYKFGKSITMLYEWEEYGIIEKTDEICSWYKKITSTYKILREQIGQWGYIKIFHWGNGEYIKIPRKRIKREESMDYMCLQYTHHIWRLWYDIVLLGQNGVT